MRRNPENWAWNNVVRGFLKGVPALDFDRIESSVGLGIPDITYSTTKGHGWIELKVGHLKGGEVTLPTLTATQRKWLYKRAVRCGSVWVWVYVPDEEAHFLVSGRLIKLVERCPLECLRVMAFWSWFKGQSKNPELLSKIL